MKICSKCKKEKQLTEFRKDKQKKDGLRSSCKECNIVYDKIYYSKNKDIIISKINKEYKTTYDKEYRIKNKEKINKRDRQYYSKNKDKYKKYYEDNKEYFKDYFEKYKLKNPDYQKEYISNRKKIDSIFKFKSSTRSLVSNSFKRKGYKKNSKTEKLLGCTIPEFIEYISSKFTEGMTLDNHGKWHIDHIIPISSAKTIEDVVRLNHYTNLQPLWAIDNIRKSNKIT